MDVKWTNLKSWELAVSGSYFKSNVEPACMYCIMHNSGGENFGESGKTNVIHQYFTQPNPIFSKVAG